MSDSSSVTLHPKTGVMEYCDIGGNMPNNLRKFLRQVSELLFPSVINKTSTAPPGSPANGDQYIPLATATGAWAGQEGKIATWSSEIATTDTDTKVPAWEFITPKPGFLIYNQADDKFYVWTTGGAWDTLSAHVGP
jgi:hypothetical protein